MRRLLILAPTCPGAHLTVILVGLTGQILARDVDGFQVQAAAA